MKLVSRSLQDYLTFVTDKLQKEYDTPGAMLLLHQFYNDLIFWITPIDLSSTASLVRAGYSPKTKGRVPRDPADMLRSTLLMTKLGMSVDLGPCASHHSRLCHSQRFRAERYAWRRHLLRLFP